MDIKGGMLDSRNNTFTPIMFVGEDSTNVTNSDKTPVISTSGPLTFFIHGTTTPAMGVYEAELEPTTPLPLPKVKDDIATLTIPTLSIKVDGSLTEPAELQSTIPMQRVMPDVYAVKGADFNTAVHHSDFLIRNAADENPETEDPAPTIRLRTSRQHSAKITRLRPSLRAEKIAAARALLFQAGFSSFISEKLVDYLLSKGWGHIEVYELASRVLNKSGKGSSVVAEFYSLFNAEVLESIDSPKGVYIEPERGNYAVRGLSNGKVPFIIPHRCGRKLLTSLKNNGNLAELASLPLDPEDAFMMAKLFLDYQAEESMQSIRKPQTRLFAASVIGNVVSAVLLGLFIGLPYFAGNPRNNKSEPIQVQITQESKTSGIDNLPSGAVANEYGVLFSSFLQSAKIKMNESARYLSRFSNSKPVDQEIKPKAEPKIKKENDSKSKMDESPTEEPELAQKPTVNYDYRQLFGFLAQTRARYVSWMHTSADFGRLLKEKFAERAGQFEKKMFAETVVMPKMPDKMNLETKPIELAMVTPTEFQHQERYEGETTRKAAEAKRVEQAKVQQNRDEHERTGATLKRFKDAQGRDCVKKPSGFITCNNNKKLPGDKSFGTRQRIIY